MEHKNAAVLNHVAIPTECPCCGVVTNRITWVLQRKNIRTITRPIQRIRDLMGSVKDPVGLRVPGVHQVPCSCGTVYIRQTGRMVAIREQECKRHLRLGNLDKSANAQHGWETGHEIMFGETRLLHRSSNWHDNDKGI